MKLKQFVAKTLREVVGGVYDAQRGCIKAGAIVNPQGLGFYADGRPYATLSGSGKDPDYVAVEYVSFDVAVTVAETNEKEKGGSIRVIGGLMGGGVSSQSGSTNSQVSRIQFRIPIVLPFTPPSPDAVTAQRARDEKRRSSVARESTRDSLRRY